MGEKMGTETTNLIDFTERRAQFTAKAVRRMRVRRDYENGNLLIQLNAEGRFAPDALDNQQVLLHVRTKIFKKRRIAGRLILKTDIACLAGNCVYTFIPDKLKDFGWLEFYQTTGLTTSNISGLSFILGQERYFWHNLSYRQPCRPRRSQDK